MRAIRVVLLLALLFGGYARADSWLEGSSEVTPSSLGRLVSMAITQPETKALLERAVGRLGLSSIDQLIDFVTICGDDLPDTQSGETRRAVRDSTLPASVEQLASGEIPENYFKTKIKQAQAANGAFETRARYTPDYVNIHMWIEPGICLKAKLGVDAAFETFIHELVHLVDGDVLADEDLLDYADEEDYLLKSVLRKGGEADAFMAGFSAQVRSKKSTGVLHPAVRGMFAADGSFTGQRLELAKVILAASPNGFGYRDGHFKGQYKSRLELAYASEVKDRDFVSGMLRNREKNMKSARHNADKYALAKIAMYEKRLNQARTRGDNALEADALENITKWKDYYAQEDAKAKAAEASLARLRPDAEAREPRIRRFEKVLGVTPIPSSIAPGGIAPPPTGTSF